MACSLPWNLSGDIIKLGSCLAIAFIGPIRAGWAPSCSKLGGSGSVIESRFAIRCLVLMAGLKSTALGRQYLFMTGCIESSVRSTIHLSRPLGPPCCRLRRFTPLSCGNLSRISCRPADLDSHKMYLLLASRLWTGITNSIHPYRGGPSRLSIPWGCFHMKTHPVPIVYSARVWGPAVSSSWSSRFRTYICPTMV